jgi:hypothetical protein
MSAEHLFDCAICRRPITTYGFNRGPNAQIAPVCRYCEGWYGDRPPQSGAFRDRRIVTQISALANALNSKAHIMMWEHRHGRS